MKALPNSNLSFSTSARLAIPKPCRNVSFLITKKRPTNLRLLTTYNKLSIRNNCKHGRHQTKPFNSSYRPQKYATTSPNEAGRQSLSDIFATETIDSAQTIQTDRNQNQHLYSQKNPAKIEATQALTP